MDTEHILALDIKPECKTLLMMMKQNKMKNITSESASNLLNCGKVKARRIIIEILNANIFKRERNGYLITTSLNENYFKGE